MPPLQVEELHDLLFEPANEDAGHSEPSNTPPATTTSASPSSSHPRLNAAVLGHRVIAPSLSHYHPSLPQAVALFAAFSENVAPLVRIFHMPTLTRAYWNAIATPWALEKHLETLLFAIHYSAIISLDTEQCLKVLGETREAALERYRFAVEQALAQGNLLGTQDMTMLQAAVLFLSALPNEDDSRAAWALTSLIFHIARTMGLHRDGTMFGLKPFDKELRRRLWWQICIIDSRSSEYHCDEPIAQDFVTDTRPPLHVDDVDLFPEMVQCPAERWDRATDMTLTLVRCEAIKTGWKLGRMRHKQTKGSSKHAAPQVDQDTDFFTQRQTSVQDLGTTLRNKYLPICDKSVPFQLLSSAVAQIILGRFWLITQYSIAPQGKEGGGEAANGTDQMQNRLRDALFEASIEILEVSGMLLTNKEIMHFYWYSKTHIQWGAMTFVLSELCSRPQSVQCDRAWDCVTTVYEAWRDDGNGQDETRLALWRPIRRLMAKARYVRELQQTDPGQPSQASRKLQRPGPAPCYVSPGSYSHCAMRASSSSWAESLQQTASSMTAAEMSLPNTLPVSVDSGSQADALQETLATDMLSPFVDFVPDWPWLDVNQVAASSPGGFHFAI